MQKTKHILVTILVSLFSFFPNQSKAQAQLNKIKHHVEVLAADSMLGRGFGSPSGKKAAEYISRQFETNAMAQFDSHYIFPFNHTYYGVEISAQNVVCVIEGSHPELKKEYIVIGAHYDHIGYNIENGNTVIYNGADDNASGVATLIELGRLINAMEQKPKRSIILVAFDGEESGLIGSENFVKNSPVPLNQIKAMFSIDMVGMYSANGGIDLTGIENLNPMSLSWDQIAKKNMVTLKTSNTKTEQRTDTYPFAKMGIPSVHVTTGTNSPYHKPEDDANLLDFQGIASITTFMTDLTIFLGNNESLQSTPRFAKNYDRPTFNTLRFGVIGGLGTNKNNYVDEFYKSKADAAIKLGIMAELKINNFISLQTEVNLNSTETQHDGGKLLLQNLTVPMNLMLTTNSLNDDGIRFFLLGGMYYSYRLSGSLDGNDLNFETTFSQQEYGTQFGTGFELQHIHLSFTKYIGLTNIYQPEAGPNIRNEGFYISVGYIF